MSFYDRLGDRFELWSGSHEHDLDFYAGLAADRAAAAGVELDLRQADMIEFEVDEPHGLIDVAGFELESLHGDFDGGPLTSTSSEYVFVTRRPG